MKKARQILVRMVCATLILFALNSLLLPGGNIVHAGPYARDQVSLNGIWNFYPNNGTTRYQINVPSYWDDTNSNNYPADWQNLTYGVYKTNFSVPSSMSGEEIYMDFAGVSSLGALYINGNRVQLPASGNYLMTLLPYDLDITNWVTVGSSNTLELHVYGSASFPADALNAGKPTYPYGTENLTGIGRRGIGGNVSLSSKPKIAVTDVQVITDLKGDTDPSNDVITLKETITNNNSTSQTVTLKNAASLDGGSLEKSWTDQSVTIPANSSVAVSLSNIAWTNAKYWWPSDPKLYNLSTSLVDASSVMVDSLSTSFGFRQFTRVSGANYYTLNGLRANLRGDTLDFLNAGGTSNDLNYTYNLPAGASADQMIKAYIDQAKALNLNVLRFHVRGVLTDEIYTYADHVGMMLIDESPYWQPERLLDYGTASINHAKEWVTQWVKAVKNHPSLIMYSSTNEAWNALDASTLMPNLRTAILAYDTTRPIYNDGQQSNLSIDDEYNFHYTGGYPLGVFNTTNLYGIYSGGTTKPVGEGESLTPSHGYPTISSDGTTVSVLTTAPFGGSPNVISQAQYVKEVGRITRGARYAGVADYRPFFNYEYAFDPIEATIHPVWSDMSASGLKPVSLYRPLINPFDTNYPTVIQGDGYSYYQNSFAPVAAFDKEFDQLNRIGASPTVYTGGNAVNQTVLIYNDELNTGTSVQINWEAGYTDPATSAYTSFASNSFTSAVAYGSTVSQPISFTIPSGITGSKQLQLKLTASKGGVQKFTETNTVGVINAVSAPKIKVTNPTISLGNVTNENVNLHHKIKLVNAGGGLTENWTATGQGGWLNLLSPSGNLRGEQEVYFTIDPAGLTANTPYTKTITFTGNSGSTATATISFTNNVSQSSDLALGKTVTTSSALTSWPGSNLTDGLSTTSWSSQLQTTSAVTEWAVIPFGAATKFDTVVLTPRNDIATNFACCFPIDFQVQGSNDGSSWTTISNQVGFQAPGAGQRASIWVGNQTYAYLRMYVTKTSADNFGSYYVQLGEISVYQNDLALGKTVTTSSALTGWPGSTLTDGDPLTTWSSMKYTTSAVSESASINFGGATAFNTVVLYPRNSSGDTWCFPVDFQIQGSNNGTTWTTLKNITGFTAPGATQRMNFWVGNQSYSYLRVLTTKASADSFGSYYVQMGGLSVYRN
ncbi:hypothetical protein A8709_28255 [Paenibacillus pectinilyticus]|uniref:F5/8 type C domain-containing protein n=1 Tax=Paenibacillus pectinilyticus TaxID=512399 RepID=A0A1C0ZUK5_9BACL|nr:glycoside hydrolase family 2 [Paenibacillus pectinilyticus]OCT11767.1 hypothetical protein A8709_28255 [Paenibacillus pectinilyticus]